jgi:hypothetical protein
VIMCDCTIPGLALALAELGLGARHPRGISNAPAWRCPNEKRRSTSSSLRVVRGVDDAGGPRAPSGRGWPTRNKEERTGGNCGM